MLVLQLYCVCVFVSLHLYLSFFLCLSIRFTLMAQSLFQIKRQLDKLGELILKVTYESDPIPLQKPQMEEQVKFLIYHLIKR